MRLKFLLALLLLGPPAWAAGTCTVSDVTSSQNASSRVPDSGTVIVTVACTGDASTGSYPSTTIPLTGSSPSGGVLNAYNLTGFVLYQVGRTPGTTQPTANYSTTVTDAQGFALDLGLLASNGSASAAQLTAISTAAVVFPVVRSALTVAITGNSVASAQITLTLVFRVNGPSGAAGIAAAPSIRLFSACGSPAVPPCMIYASGQSAAIGATTVTLPSTMNGVTCTTTPSSCVVRLTGIIHTTAAFTGSTPTVSVTLGPYNGFTGVTSTTINLTSTLATQSASATFMADVSAQQKFIYSTTFAGSPVGGTYELLILVE